MKDEQFEMLMKEVKEIKVEVTQLQENVTQLQETTGQLQENGKRMDKKLEALGDQLNTANIAILGINTEISAIKGDIKEVKDRQILMYDQMSKVVVNSAEMQNKIEDNERKLARKADKKEVIEHNEIMQDSINILYALSKVNDKQHVEYDKKLNLRRA